MNKKVALLSPNFEWKLFTLWYENSTLFGLAPLIYALRVFPISSLAIARFLEVLCDTPTQAADARLRSRCIMNEDQKQLVYEPSAWKSFDWESRFLLYLRSLYANKE